MEKQVIKKNLYRILNDDSLRLSYEQKLAVAGAIEMIEKKGELDPAWIVLLLEGLGIGIDIVNKAP